MRKTGQSDLPIEEDVSPPSSNIIRLKSYKEIPEPDLPLGETGRKVYDEWCRNLLEQGLLTVKSKQTIEMLALAKQGIANDIAKGKQPSRHGLEALRAATIRLEKLDADKTLGEADGHGNPYAVFGFAKRAKKERFGK